MRGMRAIRYDAYGGLEQVKLGELPEPRLGTGPLVRVKCAALNPKDSLFRKGKFALLSGRKFPKQCGLDFAGVVEREGGGLSVGTPVFGALNEWTFRRGTLAELVAPDAHEVAAIPPGVDAADAASIALVGLTALQARRGPSPRRSRPDDQAASSTPCTIGISRSIHCAMASSASISRSVKTMLTCAPFSAPCRATTMPLAMIGPT